MLLGYGPNKAFLLPDSCGVAERNGNSISSDVTDDTTASDYNDACFNYFQFSRCFGLLKFQDKHNIRTLSINIKSICTRYETD